MAYGTFFGEPAKKKPPKYVHQDIDPHHTDSIANENPSESLTHVQLQWIRQTQQGLSNAFRYIVKPGDTLESIAAATHTSLDHLLVLNPYLEVSMEHSGSRVSTSLGSGSRALGSRVSSSLDSVSGEADEDRRFQKRLQTKQRLYPGTALTIDKPGDFIPLPPTPAVIDQGWGQMHIVTSRDSLVSIAAAYNTTPLAIRQANRHSFPSGQKGTLYPGQLLCIRQQNNSPLVSAAVNHTVDERPEYHIIDQSKDTFESIFQQYQLNWTLFIKYNQHLFPTGSALTLVDGMKVLVSHHQSSLMIDERVEGRHHIGEIQLTKAIHDVIEADTPESIAREYHMSLDELREMNRAVFPKGYRGELSKGQKLVVKKRSE